MALFGTDDAAESSDLTNFDPFSVKPKVNGTPAVAVAEGCV